MINHNHTAVMFLLDCSGSMAAGVGGKTAYQYLEDGMYKMLEEQSRKLAGFITVDVAHFGSGFRYVSSMNDPLFVELKANASMGGTDLFGAVDKAIPQFDKNLSRLKTGYPGTVLMFIATDGGTGHDYANVGDRARSMASKGWKYGVASVDRAANVATTLNGTLIEYPNNAAGFDKMVQGMNNMITQNRGDNA